MTDRTLPRPLSLALSRARVPAPLRREVAALTCGYVAEHGADVASLPPDTLADVARMFRAIVECHAPPDAAFLDCRCEGCSVRH